MAKQAKSQQNNTLLPPKLYFIPLLLITDLILSIPFCNPVSYNCLVLVTILLGHRRQIINTFYIAHCILSKFETSLIRCLPNDSLVQTDNCGLIFYFILFFQLCSLPLGKAAILHTHVSG